MCSYKISTVKFYLAMFMFCFKFTYVTGSGKVFCILSYSAMRMNIIYSF